MIFHISLKMLMFCLESQDPIATPCYAKTVELAITIYTKQIDMVQLGLSIYLVTMYFCASYSECEN